MIFFNRWIIRFGSTLKSFLYFDRWLFVLMNLWQQSCSYHFCDDFDFRVFLIFLSYLFWHLEIFSHFFDIYCHLMQYFIYSFHTYVGMYIIHISNFLNLTSVIFQIKMFVYILDPLYYLHFWTIYHQTHTLIA